MRELKITPYQPSREQIVQDWTGRRPKPQPKPVEKPKGRVFGKRGTK